ncbi:MAG TPA: hypothetical protein VFF68_10015 [Anaerolineaceae bacterium]|nr:hypothetical protein [Anaerolineaceae bacterium]
MNVTASKLIRWSGLAAIGAGIIFAGIQPVHPPDVLSSVTTSAWAIIIALKWVMCLLFLAGFTGLYARQVERAGWLGLAGYLMLMLAWFIQTGYVFAEIFMLPVLSTAAPQFVESFLGIATMQPGQMDLGVVVPLYGLLSALIILGSLLFGIATFRARVLPRWPAALLALTVVFIPVAALLPHAIQRMVGAIPLGIAVAWLGFALFTDRQGSAQIYTTRQMSPIPQTGAEEDHL